MVSLMTEELVSGQSVEVRARLLEILDGCQTPAFLDALRQIAANQADPVRSQAEAALRSRQSGSNGIHER
jgi:hypothetical protein